MDPGGDKSGHGTRGGGMRAADDNGRNRCGAAFCSAPHERPGVR